MTVRVARVIARMNIGGPARQVAALAGGLDPARFTSHLVTGQVGPGEVEIPDLVTLNCALTTLPHLGPEIRPLADLMALASLVQELRRFRPDILHTHTAKAGLVGRLAAEIVGVPITVHTFHGHLLYGYFSSRVTRAVALAERFQARRTTKLVSVGDQVRDDLVAAGIAPAAQFCIIPPGVDVGPTPSRDAARRSLGLPADDPVVAFVGRLTKVKRADRFLEMGRLVAKRLGGRVTFVVAGEGEMRQALERQAGATGARFRFLGAVADIAPVYAASEVVVLTSDNEGTPMALIEAALHRRAAVTTDVGSVRDVVVDGVTGIVTAPDPSAIAKGVIGLIENSSLRRDLANAAFDRAHGRYGAARLIRDHEELYESLLGAKST